jgi:hypothetical protein
VVEHKNPLFMRRASSSSNTKQSNRLSDIYSESEVSALIESLRARAQLQDPVAKTKNSATDSPTVITNVSSPMERSPSSPQKSLASPLSRLSMKLKNRKSVEIEPGFLRVASAPNSSKLRRRGSVEIVRESSFRYRAGSDAPPPEFLPDIPEHDRLTMSSSASFSTPTSDIDLRQSHDLKPSPPLPFSDPEEACCDSIVYADEKRKLVVAATVDQSIYLLAGNNAPDKDFISQFLRTHHRFIDSKDFLQKLIDRYNLPAAKNISEEEYIKKKKIVQVRIINVIKKWIELQLSDFVADPTLVAMLQGFVSVLKQTGGTEAIWASNLQIALIQSEDEKENPSVVVTSEEDKPPKPILPKNMIVRLMQFLDVNPLEMARQLTLIDSCALCKVPFDEYEHKKWSSEGSKKLAPNLLEIIERFNKTSFWISSEIVKQTDLRLRVKVLSKCIKLMKHLMDMGNMQGMMAVYSALNTTPIQRLQETWKNLPSKYYEKLKSVGDLMNSSQNYKNYRDHVRNATRPFIPFQLIYLSDLTFMEEAPDKLGNDMINFKKMGLVGTLLNEIYSFRQITHSFTPVPSIQEFITLCIHSALDEEQLYSSSKTIEPRKEI